LSSARVGDGEGSGNRGVSAAASGGGRHGRVDREIGDVGASDGGRDAGDGRERVSASDGDRGDRRNAENGVLSVSVAASVDSQVLVDQTVVIVVKSVSDFLIDSLIAIVIETVSGDSGGDSARVLKRGESRSSDVSESIVASESVNDDGELLNGRVVRDLVSSSGDRDFSIDVASSGDS